MGPKKKKLTEVPNQQRITAFFTSVTASSRSVKRSPQHNSGVSPNAKRDTTTSGKEHNPYPCKKNLSEDLGVKLSQGQQRSNLQGGLTGKDSVLPGLGSASQAKESPRSHLTASRKSRKNNRKGSLLSRNTKSSMLSMYVSTGGGYRTHLPGKPSKEDDDDDDIIILSDSDDVCNKNELKKVSREEIKLFSLSDSSQDAWNNNSAGLTQTKDEVSVLSDSENSDENNEFEKLHAEKDIEKQSTSPNSSQELCPELCRTTELYKLNGAKEEETSGFSDCSEDLFISPLKIKPKKDSGRQINDKVALCRASMKQECDTTLSSDDELTPTIGECSQGFHLNGESNHNHITPEGSEAIMKGSQDLKPMEEDPDHTTETTTSMINNSQDLKCVKKGTDGTPDVATDMFNCTQDSECIKKDTNGTPDVATDMFNSTQDSECMEKGTDGTPDVATDMFNCTQDSECIDKGTDGTPDVATDILKASQGFTLKENVMDIDKEIATDVFESMLDFELNADGAPDTLNTRNASVEVPRKLSPKEDLECHVNPENLENLSPLKEDLMSKNVPVLNGNNTSGTMEAVIDSKKVPSKPSNDEEMDCLDIMEMFGELSPFKERPAREQVHGLLTNDPIVKKFLNVGQAKESFATQGNFGRHLVLAAKRDSSARTIHLELLSPQNEKRTCTLAGTWSDTVVRDGDIIHILLTQPVDNHYHIDNNQGLAVVHPDLLVSSTSVASGVFCQRRAVLAEWHRGIESTSAVMMLGSLVHELFQDVVVEVAQGGVQLLSEKMLQSHVSRLLGHPKVLQDLYRLGHTLDSMREDVAAFIPQVMTWCTRYLQQNKNTLDIGSYKWQGRITHVEEVEENLWSPRLGLKGKVDMVVRAERPDGSVILPLELKTGKASFSAEHRGQLALYSMMGSDRRPDPRAGLLLYLREGAMEETAVPARECRDLIHLRNDLAFHLAARPKVSQVAERKPGLPPLPPPIAHKRGCQQCPHKVTCTAHLILQEEVPADPHPMASLVPQYTAHLSTQHLEYFRHWCLLYQLEAAESLGGGGAVWCRNAVQREEEGECLAWLVLGEPVPVEVRPGMFRHRLVRGRRHPGSTIPVASVGLHIGDPVIVSSTKVLALACGKVQGFSEGAVIAELDRLLEGGIAHHYHLDLNQTTNFFRLPMQSLARLILKEPRAEALRRLVVDKATPSFKKRLPSQVLASKSMLSHLNSKQKRAVIQAVAAEDYLVVQGFPGTGKSSTLATMVKVLLLLNRSILITAYTNTALDSLLLKLHNLGIDFLRLGWANKVHPDLASHTEEARSAQIHTVEELTEFYASQRVVAATSLGLGHSIFSRRTFDVCIVDEAAQVLQVTALGPLFLCSSFVLVGDNHQLPPVVRSKCAVLHGMTETLFDRLHQPEVTVTLTKQYRMNGPIMALANHLTYNNQLTCGNHELETAALNLPHYQSLVEEGVVVPWLQRVVAPTLDESVVFVDTAGGAQETKVKGSSVNNYKEAKLVITLVRILLKAGLSAGDIGIITPYLGQVKLLKTLLTQELEEEGKSVEVNTVDQYQGRDKIAIICTFVRCGKTDDKPLGILSDRRRLNVALTRAKRKLILVGDQTTLTRYQSFSCLVDVLAPHQVYRLTPGTDGFLWEEEDKDMKEAEK